MTEALIAQYGDYGKSLLPVAVCGPTDTCIEELRAVAVAGAEMILINPLFDAAYQMERLAAEVLPHVA
ncbi:hypothetical protein [Nocardia brasiliensis]|uniref:Luciferase-like protein n=1 Tax=Nocardia brasiliensis (strain ATCC 700358 / HUJEG-1) TaxID=1133849 RepID=K0ERD3_NOCB7|nr:luciferase-like protein [Nocardia brasiliensis ATCC 700358]OCF90302.1 hypothetical protein AW168_09940 [Nocardia brasiliensis]